MRRDLAGHVIIITGGGRGIGLAVARALIDRGARVALFGRNRDTLASAVEELGIGAVSFVLDITDREGLFAAVEQVATHFGRIDGLLNNAGTLVYSRCEALDAAAVHQQVSVNFVAAVFACQAVIPHLRRAGGGTIVNISSSAVRHKGEAFSISVYVGTKAALERFSADLRDEVKIDGIGVTIFSPGGTASKFAPPPGDLETDIAIAKWIALGDYYDGAMELDLMGEAVARCFDAPRGTAYDLVEFRTNGSVPRIPAVD